MYKNSKQKYNRSLLVTCGLILLLFLTAISGCSNQSGQEEKKTAEKAPQTPVVIASKFAKYEEVTTRASQSPLMNIGESGDSDGLLREDYSQYQGVTTTGPICLKLILNP